MKRLQLFVILVILAVPLAASAASDLGDGKCVQTDGVEGVWNGGPTTDDGCTTLAEYAENTSPEGLLADGVIVGYEDVGDGTVVLDFGAGVKNTVKADPFDRVVAANQGDPGPTVREWFDTTFDLRFGPR
jgi:hypothetical protein